MTDLSTERRAELRANPFAIRSFEVQQLLDATELVADAEVREARDNLLGIAGVLYEKKCPDDAGALIEAAALLERQARHLAEMRRMKG
jgi:hypothetical protein